MSIEASETLSHFRYTAKEKGKKALEISKRAVSPILYAAGTAGIIAGIYLLATHLKEDGNVDHRTIKDATIIALSFAVFLTPSLSDKIINKLKRRKSNANSPESRES